MALMLRLLGGGSSYDLGIIFDILFKTCYDILYHIIQYWIINTDIGKINIEDHLDKLVEMKHVSNGFSKRSNRLLTGAIGAIDG